jgi:3-(3-hydroxy-phenyl)propionate hydroxylase
MSMDMPSREPRDVEVLIVGAGPTGLVAANLLGQAGVRTLLIEQASGLSAIPKALMVDDEFFRLLHKLGLGEKLAQHGVYPVGYDFYSPLGPRVGHIAGRTTENGFPSRTATFQPEFENILFDGLRRFPSVEALFDQKLESFADNGGEVGALVRDSDGQASYVRADYLIAADGSHSLCRKVLVIPFDELAPVEVRHVVIDIADDPNHSTTAELKLGWRRNANSLPAPGGRRRYEFSLRPEEDIEQALSAATLDGFFRQFFGVPCPRNIIRKTVYAFHARLARQMSKGRVFLAGDAAHIMPVIGSQGMNSGARDVHNLAWKLALVLRAGADPSILASYDIERRPQVESTIRAVTAALHLQKARSIPATIVRDIAAMALNLLPPIARYVRDMRYIPKPFLEQGLVAPHTRSGEASLVGRLLPLPQIRSGNAIVPLDDVLGPGFAIVGIEPVSAPPNLRDALWYALSAQVATIWRRRRTDVEAGRGVQACEVADGRFDAVLAAHRGEWLIVRPDRIVAAAVEARSFPDATRFFTQAFGIPPSLRQAAE